MKLFLRIGFYSFSRLCYQPILSLIGFIMQETSKDNSTEALNRSLKRLMSSSTANSRLAVVDTPIWISTVGLVILLIAFLLAAFFTNLTVFVEGRGIVEVKDNKTVIYAFVPFEKAQNIHTGLKVLIEFPNVNTQQYGQLKGTISNFSFFTLTEKQKTEFIPNQILRETVLEGIKTPVLFEVTPDEDPSTPSGFKWTSPGGPPYKIDAGTIGRVRVAIYNIQPFYYIFFPSPPSEKEVLAE